MIRWRVADFLAARGWTAYRFAEEAGIPRSLAYRLARPDPVQRIDAGTLVMLCRLFDATPGDLLVYEP